MEASTAWHSSSAGAQSGTESPVLLPRVLVGLWCLAVPCRHSKELFRGDAEAPLGPCLERQQQQWGEYPP